MAMADRLPREIGSRIGSARLLLRDMATTENFQMHSEIQAAALADVISRTELTPTCKARVASLISDVVWERPEHGARVLRAIAPTQEQSSLPPGDSGEYRAGLYLDILSWQILFAGQAA